MPVSRPFVCECRTIPAIPSRWTIPGLPGSLTLFPTVSPAHTLVRRGGRLRPDSAGSTIPRLWPTGSSAGIAPVDYDPVVLLKPFGPRLAAALQKVADGGSRSAYPYPGFRHRASLASPYLPSLLAGEALPPPSDISPGSRAEFNPPDASAVRHTLRVAPPLCPASVL